MQSVMKFLYTHFVVTAVMHTHNIRIAMLTILWSLGDTNPELPNRTVTAASRLRLLRAFIQFSKSENARLPGAEYFLSISQAAKDAVTVALGLARLDHATLLSVVSAGGSVDDAEEMMSLKMSEWSDVYRGLMQCCGCGDGCLPLLHDRRYPDLISKTALELANLVQEMMIHSEVPMDAFELAFTATDGAKCSISRSAAKRLRRDFVTARRNMWHSPELQKEINQHAIEWFEDLGPMYLDEKPKSKHLLASGDIRSDLGHPTSVDPVKVCLGNGMRGRHSKVTEAMTPVAASELFLSDPESWPNAYLEDADGRVHKTTVHQSLESVEFWRNTMPIARVHVDFDLVPETVS